MLKHISSLLLCGSIAAQGLPTGVVVTDLGGGCSSHPFQVSNVFYHTAGFGWCPALNSVPHYSSWFQTPTFCPWGTWSCQRPDSALLVGLTDPDVNGPTSMLPPGCVLHSSYEVVSFAISGVHWHCAPAGFGGTINYQRLDWGLGIQDFELSNGVSVYYP